jgi:hypothetical protein
VTVLLVPERISYAQEPTPTPTSTPVPSTTEKVKSDAQQTANAPVAKPAESTADAN